MKEKITILLLFSVLFFQKSNAQSLKMMTYNIRLDIASDGENSWENRKSFFCSQLQFYEPDIFGVQEAKPNQVQDIRSSLEQYAAAGTGRDGNGQGESSHIFYHKKRFKLLKQHTFWLSETPDTVSKGWDAACNRVCTYVLLKDILTNKTFWVFNTHLDHLGEEARTKGLALILNQIQVLNVAKLPVFLMGDFNLDPSSPRIQHVKSLLNDARDISINKPYGPSGTFNNFKHNEPVTLLIDYIFLSKENPFFVQKYAILSDAINLKYPSDHLPVFVELILKK